MNVEQLTELLRDHIESQIKIYDKSLQDSVAAGKPVDSFEVGYISGLEEVSSFLKRVTGR